jgi:hypothetical protein
VIKERIVRLEEDTYTFRTKRFDELKAQRLDGDVVIQKLVILEMDVQALKEAVKALAEGKQNTNANDVANHTNGDHNNITNNITNNNDNRTYIVFGKVNPDMPHISYEFLEKCVRKGAAGVIDCVEAMHFNSEHPEMKNVRIQSMKAFRDSGLLDVCEEKGWTLTPKTPVIASMWVEAFCLLRRPWGDWECDGETDVKLGKGEGASQAKDFMEQYEEVVTHFNLSASLDASEEKRKEIKDKVDRAEKDIMKIARSRIEGLLIADYNKTKAARG